MILAEVTREAVGSSSDVRKARGGHHKGVSGEMCVVKAVHCLLRALFACSDRCSPCQQKRYSEEEDVQRLQAIE